MGFIDRDSVTIRPLKGERSEMGELQRVIEGAPTYAELVTGLPPGRADAQSMYTILPEGKSYEDKFVFGIYRGSEMVGCVDLIRGYPDASTAYCGLLLVSEEHQRRGIGRRAFEL
ncbi:MAG TPA: GNAT family N-acetyltransferase, partial [Bacillota bacterium]|nr:GNAT family N-acetyltransferase [Bacillota bacterium]